MLFGHQADSESTVQPLDEPTSGSAADSTAAQPIVSGKDPVGSTATPSGPAKVTTASPVPASISTTSTDSLSPKADTLAVETQVISPPTETVQAPGVTTTDDSKDLLKLKQQALSQLAPLVDQLEQSPEEKFKTTMMMLQSTDNQALIKDAYAAAQAITEERARAQALLDVVNEINYFTHKDQPTQ